MIWLSFVGLAAGVPMPVSAQTPQGDSGQAPAQRNQVAATWTDWNVSCRSATAEKGLDCQATRAVVLKKTRSLLLRVTVNLPAETKKPVMMIQMPTGLYLPAGASMAIDDETPKPIVLQTCNGNGCFSGSPVSEEILAGMKTGTWFKVTFKDLKRKQITVALPLDGFPKAYEQMEGR
jgi:invasion protein IalB